MRDQNTRAMLVEAVIAGGLLAIEIPVSQPLVALATIAAGVGGNWAHSLAERGFQHWRERWFTDDGVLNHDIAKALCHAFVEALRQVEYDWRHHRHYQYLQRKYPEQAQLTLDALRLLREDGATLFQQPNQLAQIIQQEQQNHVLSLLEQDKSKVSDYLKPALDEFLYGHDDAFVTFVTEQLGSKWILRFLELLKDPGEEGTRAWRACQLLWQKSLMRGIEQMQRTTADTADAVQWLQAWAQQLKSLPPTQRNSTGQEALETIVHSMHAQLDEMQNTLDKTYATTLDIKATLEQASPKGGPAEIVPAVSQAAVLELNNRKIMLGRVEQIWITGLLEKSLYQQVQILLDLHERPHAVSNSWHFVVQELASSTGSLPAELSIQDAYDHAGGALLLLGEPGAGKTTLLLELLRMLIQRARQDDIHPIPVVFNLSSWAARRLPLDHWFVEELNGKYQIPRPLAQAWIRQYSILPLLDGLDEVVPAARAACANAINIYRNAYGLTPLVVCCRQAEYDELIAKTQQKLHLRTAVQIQPLTPQHIDAYLSDAGPALAALNTAIQKNRTLQELVTSPLMLSVLSLAYQDASPDEIQITDERQVFALYVQRMLTRRGVHVRYTAEQTKKWLAHLAQHMVQRGQTEFYLEQLQKDWFPHEKIYRLCVGLAFGVVAGLFIFLFYAATYFFQSVSWYGKVGFPFLLGLFNVGIVTLLYGLVLNWTDSLVVRVSARPAQRLLSFIKRQCARLLDNRVLYGLLLGVANGLLLIRYPQYINFFYALLNALALSVGYTFIGRTDTSIQPVEAIVWSWKIIRTNLIKFFGMGLLVGFLFSLSFGPIFTLIDSYRHNDPASLASALNSEHITDFFLTGSCIGFGLGIIFTLIGGIAYTTLEKNKHITPNQGIRTSARNGLVLGLSSSLFVGLIAALIFGPFTAWISETTLGIHSSLAGILTGVGWGISCGIGAFAVVGLRNGGLACIQHFLLRFLLWRTGAIPWHFTRFLDEAASRILLYRVGGGYRFIHQLFLGYFASLAPTPVQVTAHASNEASSIAPPPQLSPAHVAHLASNKEDQARVPLHTVEAAWFVRLGLITLLVFCGYVGVAGIDAYQYRARIEHVMATSPYPAAFPGHGTIKLYDPLSEPNQWNCEDNYVQYVGNAFHMRETAPFSYIYCRSNRIFSEFAFSVNMTIVKGDCGGIIFGYTNIFDVCANGTYYVCGGYGCYHLIPAINNGKRIINTRLNQSNTLGMVLRKDGLSLFINYQNIAYIQYYFGMGWIGLAAESHNHVPIEVVYKDAKVWAF